MILKKQTVWLLTMLSLIVVLSAYFFLPQNGTEQLAFLENDETNNQAVEEEEDEGKEGGKEEEGSEEAPLDGEESTDQQDMVVNIKEELEELEEVGQVEEIGQSTSEVFASIRMNEQENRDRQEEENNTVAASPESSPTQVVEALDKNKEIREMAQQETELEKFIMAEGGYEDVLVMSVDNEVRIYVNAEELSREQTVEIIQLATEKLGTEKQVAVGFQ
ncbi:hypothetical protein BTS2_0696 [Bacillus sp. TS-2]|nr:hypothetical protein BTS2_0696 [Bacillus sp. TS-2]